MVTNVNNKKVAAMLSLLNNINTTLTHAAMGSVLYLVLALVLVVVAAAVVKR